MTIPQYPTSIGDPLPGVPNWFHSLPGDTNPDGTVTPGTSQGGIAGLFRKVASPIDSDSNPHTGTVGGWWVKVG